MMFLFPLMVHSILWHPLISSPGSVICYNFLRELQNLRSAAISSPLLRTCLSPNTQEIVKGIKYTFFHSFYFLNNDEKIGEVDIVLIRHLRVCPIAGYI